MKIAVATCWAYRDAWQPFYSLLKQFWRDHPEIIFLTDEANLCRLNLHEAGKGAIWCKIIETFASKQSQPILLMQEDFFLNSFVNTGLIYHALGQLRDRKAGCIRLYPCPGGIEYYGNPYYATVPRGTAYRISCQAAIWDPDYLAAIASQCGTAAEFELRGSLISNSLPHEVLAFRREVTPWPMEYLCSGISRGLWNPDSKRLFESNGIKADYSLRGFAA